MSFEKLPDETVLEIAKGFAAAHRFDAKNFPRRSTIAFRANFGRVYRSLREKEPARKFISSEGSGLESLASVSKRIRGIVLPALFGDVAFDLKFTRDGSEDVALTIAVVSRLIAARSDLAAQIQTIRFPNVAGHCTQPEYENRAHYMADLLLHILPYLPKLRKLSSIYLNAQLAVALDSASVRRVDVFATNDRREIVMPSDLLKTKEKILKKMWIDDFYLDESEQFVDMAIQLLELGVNVQRLLTERVTDTLECVEFFEWNTVQRMEIWCCEDEYAPILTQQLAGLLQRANMSTVEEIFIPLVYSASIAGAYLSLPLFARFPQTDSNGSSLSDLQKAGGLWIKDYTLRRKVHADNGDKCMKVPSTTIGDPGVYWPLNWEIYQLEIYVRVDGSEELVSKIFDWLQCFSGSVVKLKIKLEWKSSSQSEEEDEEQMMKQQASVEKLTWTAIMQRLPLLKNLEKFAIEHFSWACLPAISDEEDDRYELESDRERVLIDFATSLRRACPRLRKVEVFLESYLYNIAMRERWIMDGGDIEVIVL